jgi:hypothetical protein
MDHYYNFQNSNVHRGVHHLSMLATAAYEDARSTVARFIGASSHREVIFTRNATESINLVAQSWGEANLQTGDEVCARLSYCASSLMLLVSLKPTHSCKPFVILFLSSGQCVVLYALRSSFVHIYQQSCSFVKIEHEKIWLSSSRNQPVFLPSCGLIVTAM